MLAFLHTASAHVATFSELLTELDARIPSQHAVHEELLALARRLGPDSAELREATAAAIRRLIHAGARVILCTCSSVGAVAETTPVPNGSRVLRVDRPLAERAVASGARVLVCATLESTLGPTSALLREIAAERGSSVELTEVLCDAAWPFFERGDRQAYAEEIAISLRERASASDVVVLAQASMAAAIPMLKALPCEVLSSPRLGVQAALESYATALDLLP